MDYLTKFNFRKSSLQIIVLLIVTFSACSKQETSQPEVKVVKNEDPVLVYIKSLGYKDSDIQDIGIEYLVDGDILFPKNNNNSSNSKNKTPKTSQYGGGYYVNGENIIIQVDPSMTNYLNEITSAINQWNNISGFRLHFSIYINGQPDLPNITITNSDLGTDVCGAARFPINGNPGSIIRINVNEIASKSFDQRQRTITHELGHAIGIRHTNWYGMEPATGQDDAGSPINAIHIPNTPGQEGEQYSLMNGGQCGYGATSLSAFDKATARYLYPKPSHTIQGLCEISEGAGIISGQINSNSIPDVIFMVYDAPTGPNQFRYKIAYDMDNNGNPAFMSSTKYVDGMGDHCEGTGIALADIDNNGQKDIVLMAYDAPSGPNQFRYKIGYNPNTNGDVSSWSSVKYISGIADASQGAGISFGDIDKNGILDIVLMAYDIPAGPNQLRYKVGYNINTNGDASFWSTTKYLTGLGDTVDGTAIELTDIDNNGTLDLVFFADDNPPGPNEFRYKIGFNLNSTGIPAYYSNIISYVGVGDFCEGAGLSFTDLDGNGTKEIILMAQDAPLGINEFRYRIGFNLNNSGITSEWR